MGIPLNSSQQPPYQAERKLANPKPSLESKGQQHKSPTHAVAVPARPAAVGRIFWQYQGEGIAWGGKVIPESKATTCCGQTEEDKGNRRGCSPCAFLLCLQLATA